MGTGRLDGSVVDPTGGVMPGCKVIAIHQANQTRSEVTTNADGNFVFPALQPGIYTISVEATGFRTAVLSGVEVNLSTAVTQKFSSKSARWRSASR
ncbi:MAG: carboxypeptidase-like regulatory domain-containing protein [Ignavibacteriota bacterium]